MPVLDDYWNAMEIVDWAGMESASSAIMYIMTDALPTKLSVLVVSPLRGALFLRHPQLSGVSRGPVKTPARLSGTIHKRLQRPKLYYS